MQVDRINVRIKADEMCIPHISTDLYTKDVSGIDKSLLNVTYHCKSGTNTKVILSVIENYLMLSGIKSFSMRMDVQTFTATEGLDVPTLHILNKINGIKEEDSESGDKEEYIPINASIGRPVEDNIVTSTQRNEQKSTSQNEDDLKTEDNLQLSYNTSNRLMQPSEFNNIDSSTNSTNNITKTEPVEPPNPVAISSAPVIQGNNPGKNLSERNLSDKNRFNTTAQEDVLNGFHLGADNTARGITNISARLLEISRRLSAHINENPNGIPDFTSRTAKGKIKICNYINNNLSLRLSVDDAILVAMACRQILNKK